MNDDPLKIRERECHNPLLPVAGDDLDRFRRLHQSGAISIRDNDDEALRLAAANGQVKILQYLHQNGCDIHARSDEAMRLAAANGHWEVVRYLHQNGCAIRACDDEAIRLAAASGRLEVLRYLHQNGSDIRACDDEPVRSAAANGHLEALRYLHRNGCDIRARNDEPIRAGAGNGHLEIVAYLRREGADIRACRDVAAALVQSREYPEVLAYLSKYGVHRSTCGLDALLASVVTGDLAGVRRLHLSGIDIRARDDESLRLAAANGQLEVLHYLYQNGCSLHADSEGALRLAAANGRLDIVKYLHQNGCDIREGNDCAIKAAAENGHLDVVRYLHQNGCDIRKCEPVAADLVRRAENREIVRYFADNGVEKDGPKRMALLAAIKRGSLEEVKSAFVDIDIVAHGGDAIKVAAENGFIEVVKFLREMGCDLHVDNEAALEAAAENGPLEVVKYLHQTGCDIHAGNDAALKAAAENGQLEVVKYLHQNGCDIAAIDSDTLSLAEYSGHISVFNYLTDNGLDGIAKDRLLIEAMHKEIFSSDPIYRPSRLWEYFNAVNMEQLRRGGINHFKRSINQNYFNFVPLSFNDPQVGSLFRWWIRHPRLTFFKTLLIDPDTNPETGARLAVDRSVFTLLGKHKLSGVARVFQMGMYRWLVSMLWDFAVAHDKMRLLPRLAEPRLGSPIEIWHGNRVISQDLAHSVLECNAILGDIDESPAAPPLRIAEVGAGYGRLGYVLLHARRCKYVVFDIPPGLYVSQWYLSRLFPEKRIFPFRPFQRFEDIADEFAAADIAFFTADQIELMPPGYFDICINISSLHELKPDQITNMLSQMYRVTRRYVYLKQYKEYINPWDDLVIREDSYPVPEGWRHKYYRKDPVDSRFFETLIESVATAGEASDEPDTARGAEATAEDIRQSDGENKLPTVSILLANYNHARYLPTSLAGILSQTRPANEIIIVDDGSTDDSIAVIQEFAARCPNVRLLRNDRNRGQHYSIQKALLAATGEYVVWASADDLLLPEFLERSLSVLEKHREAGLCFSRLAAWVDGTNNVRHYTGETHGVAFEYGDEPHYLSPPDLFKVLRRHYLWISGNTVLAKKAALLEMGGFERKLKWHSDWFGFYAVALRYGACAIPETLAMMRERPATYSAAGSSDPVHQGQVLAAILATIKAPKYRDLLPVFRRCPSMLSLFGRQMLFVAARDIRHFDIFVPKFFWHLGHYLQRHYHVLLYKKAGLSHRVSSLLRWVAARLRLR